MRRISHSRPSPAIVVAVLSLVAALAGTAVAADPPEATSSALTKKKVKKTAKKVSNKQITKRAPTLHVAEADVAGTVQTGLRGTSVNIPQGTGFADVATVPVTTGNHLVFSRTVVEGTSGVQQVNCRLLVGGNVIDTTQTGIESGFEIRGSLDLHGVARLTAASNATLQCETTGPGGSSINVSNTRITSLSVLNATETAIP